MKTKTLKIVTTILMALFILCTISQVVFGATGIEVQDVELPSGIKEMAGKIVGLIRAITIIAIVVLVPMFGFKFVMGSANEKADYQKSFIPLIVGTIVVFASTFIADFLIDTIK